MRNARIALILTGLAFGIWEATDVFKIEVPEAAALFAVLFLGCTAWFWRRGSVRPVGLLAILFAFEAAAAPTWHHVMTITKVAAFTLGVVGLASAVAVLVTRRRARPSRAYAAG